MAFMKNYYYQGNDEAVILWRRLTAECSFPASTTDAESALDLDTIWTKGDGRKDLKVRGHWNGAIEHYSLGFASV